MELSAEVVLIKIDHPIPDFSSYVKQFAAVVAGPGPGHPANFGDVGLIRDLWTLKDEDLRPVLGICLGFQSLVHAFGGAVVPMRHPRHGVATEVTSRGASIFHGLESFRSVQYHSLRATLGHHDQGFVSTSLEHMWRVAQSCPDLEPLAWDMGAGTDLHPTNEVLEPVLMAVKHVSKPFYGIQFHLESVCSGTGGEKSGCGQRKRIELHLSTSRSYCQGVLDLLICTGNPGSPHLPRCFGHHHALALPLRTHLLQPTYHFSPPKITPKSRMIRI